MKEEERESNKEIKIKKNKNKNCFKDIMMIIQVQWIVGCVMCVCVLVVPIYDMNLPNFCLEHSGYLRGVKVTAAKATVNFLQNMVRFIYFPF